MTITQCNVKITLVLDEVINYDNKFYG